MDELVFKSEKGTPVTNSLLVAQKFGKEHKHVLEVIRTLAENSADLPNLKNMFYETSQPDTYGRLQPLFVMNRDGFTLLVMGFSGRDALKFKLDFINAFNKMEETIKNGNFPIPKTYAEALMIAAKQAEKIEQQQEQLSKQSPKVLFADAVATSNRSILVSELAKILKQNGIEIGQNRLFQWLRDHGYLCTKGEYRNQPSQRAMELGLFEIKKTTINKPDGSILVSRTTKVTGKGQVYFTHKLLSPCLTGE